MNVLVFVFFVLFCIVIFRVPTAGKTGNITKQIYTREYIGMENLLRCREICWEFGNCIQVVISQVLL